MAKQVCTQRTKTKFASINYYLPPLAAHRR